ncbi:hypothetical protein Tco_1449490 [Tanacetum coccineum]
MMNHIVPEFETEEDCLIPDIHKKSTMGGDEDIMELLWHNGQVVMQSQNQRSSGNKKPLLRPAVRSIEQQQQQIGPSDLFMQEDEMSSWLHYPVEYPANENSLEGYLYNNDLLFPTPSPNPITTTHMAPTTLPPPPPPSVVIPSPRPPVAPIRRNHVDIQRQQPKYPSFLHFSRPNKAKTLESGPSVPVTEASESRASRVSEKPPPMSVGGESVSGVGLVGTSSTGREVETCNTSMMSSPDGSGTSGSIEPSTQMPPPSTSDRKRKGRDTEDTECHSEYEKGLPKKAETPQVMMIKSGGRFIGKGTVLCTCLSSQRRGKQVALPVLLSGIRIEMEKRNNELFTLYVGNGVSCIK